MISFIFDKIYPSCKNQEEQTSILRSIIEVTEGKMYVEYEFSLAVRKLTEILLNQGNREEATKLIQDIQIETFGSLEKLYKVEYILFQIKVLIEKGDFIRTLIVSNKVVRKHLEEKGMEGIKVAFYLLMVKYYIKEEKYLQASESFQVLFEFYKNTEAVKELINSKKNILDIDFSALSSKDLFEKFIYFLNISPADSTTLEKIKDVKVKYVKELEEYPTLGKLINLRSGDDIVEITESFLSQFNNSTFIDNSELFIEGKKNAKLFRKYIIQHNLLIFHKFYNQVFLNKIADFIKVSVEEVELEVCDMVMNKYIYARINRIKGVVTFRPKQTHERKSDALNEDLLKMLETLENTCHLIHKENLKYGIKTK